MMDIIHRACSSIATPYQFPPERSFQLSLFEHQFEHERIRNISGSKIISEKRRSQSCMSLSSPVKNILDSTTSDRIGVYF